MSNYRGQPARKKTELSVAVAAQLRAERAAARVTIDELAEQTGMTRQTLMRLLNEQRTMDLSQFAAICETLRVSPVVVMARATDERIPRGHEPDLT